MLELAWVSEVVILATSPDSADQISINAMRSRRKVTYSIEAWMKMSCFTLNAADHARGTGFSRVIAPCGLHPLEGVEATREPIMSLSVVATKLSMRSPNFGLTAHK